ncbi:MULTISPECIES: monovalent cation/H+ antiporter subunit A [unclassified Methylophaga]|jgi:multicomponent K+:H+ antiporter subunit A|uniref:monovalent cation/H+ antiporter subunit A n=2 Tax=Methylophaga TaxID=40222 RepID=UPI000C94CF8E|nr:MULTISPECIES: monovalent cation/H+ antiporter subunit A [unclassified Methylophaga]MAK65976.1 monovalent cation/H+ antiporter subunit A [Methylophaga sp.]MAY18647.1 monovalent cation/H+ antiporter subunit A [Methylophaga sp.]
MSLLSFNLPIVALLPFAAAPFAAWATRYNRLASAWIAGLTTLLTLAILFPSMQFIFAGETLIQQWSWLPSIGFNLAFRLDGLALLFALLILLIGLLIIFYARYYLSAKDSMGRFYAYMLMFMGSMLGIVLSENLLQLVVFWELTSITSFLLISYWQHRQDARQGARMALAVTGAGGLALLGGVLLLGHIVGSYQLSDVLASGELIKGHDLYLPTLVLILLGVFTKSAQFPFHFWLPHAMAAPTPVSAYLHSATMVKAGIFLLARFFPALSGTPEWMWMVGTAGMITLLLGAYVALFKHDLKGLLAYSTLSHLGLITLLFGFSSELALVAAIFHIINHATFKGSLFMVAGIIDHESGTRDMRKLNGLFKMMPHTAMLAMIAAAAMAGVPLLNGFLSKEMFFEQAISASGTTLAAWTIPVLVTLAAIFSVAYSLRFIHDVFFNGEPIDLPKTPHEPPRFMKIPVDILVVLCLLVGVAPMFLISPILTVAVASSLQTAAPEFSLAIWHGFNLPLMMSFIALVLGVAVYSMRHRLFAWHDRCLHGLDGKAVFDWVLWKIIRLSKKITDAFDQTTLQPAVTWVIGGALMLSIITFFQFNSPLLGDRVLMEADVITFLMSAVLIIASILTVMLHHKRLVSLIAIGVVGLVVALGFVKFSAPDLALTQLSVEVVTIVLLLLALFFLPQHTPQERSYIRFTRDGVISVAAAVSVFFLTMAVLSRDYSPISGFFIDNAKPGGGGTNVVNVILVDFRGFDTLGEIVVLALAGICVFAMLEGLKLAAPAKDVDGLVWSHDPHPPIMQTLTRLLFPLMLMVAVFIFLRGHNLPGGGFIAGLIASVALISQYLANGIDWTNERLRIDMHRVIWIGLLVATLTGVVSMLIGYPFLTTAFTYLTWPVVGKFEVASAIAFDLGVFLVVVGATVMILVELGKLSHASHHVKHEEVN